MAMTDFQEDIEGWRPLSFSSLQLKNQSWAVQIKIKIFLQWYKLWKNGDAIYMVNCFAELHVCSHHSSSRVSMALCRDLQDAIFT